MSDQAPRAINQEEFKAQVINFNKEIDDALEEERKEYESRRAELNELDASFARLAEQGGDIPVTGKVVADLGQFVVAIAIAVNGQKHQADTRYAGLRKHANLMEASTTLLGGMITGLSGRTVDMAETMFGLAKQIREDVEAMGNRVESGDEWKLGVYDPEEEGDDEDTRD